ncbi:MAG: hypothetical protein ACRDVE_18095 [Actinocrinis sp.]
MRQEEIPDIYLLKQDDFSRMIRRAHLHPTTKLIALHLMTYANYVDGKQIFPGEKLIAAELGRTTRCVREHLKILRDLRILTRVHHNSGRFGVYDEYWLSWPIDDETVGMRLRDEDGAIPDMPRVRLPRKRENERKRIPVQG